MKDEYVVYKRNVCKIKEIKNIYNEQYYVLVPIDDNTLKISVPKNRSNLFRNVISALESEELIKKIASIEIINVPDKQLEIEYNRLLNTGRLEDLVKIIKTTYLRNEDRVLNHKKIGEKDDNYFKMAERLLYNELSISLNKTVDEVKQYIFECLKKYNIDCK